MFIKCYKTDTYVAPHQINDLLWPAVKDKFTYQWETLRMNGRKFIWVAKIRQIRLVTKKPYCGNHPEMCELQGFGNTKPRMGNYLEGTDWVDWNDRLNDVLDSVGLKADVATAACVVRKGTTRRVQYDSYWIGNFALWEQFGPVSHYEDWCGKVAPASIYPFGTPGDYDREIA